MTRWDALDRAEWIRHVLQMGGNVVDSAFDALYPAPVRERSEIYWTPVSVAVRAAALLAPEPGMSVLDVGAGCGKPCCIGALVTTALWHGVERDPELVATAYATAVALRVDHRTSFSVGDATRIAWNRFDAVYLFNPFEAALFADGPLDEPYYQTRRWLAYCDELEATEDRLADMPAGTRVVTYHGFGGDLPGNYSLAYRDPVETGFLSLWIKGSNAHVTRPARYVPQT